MKFRSLSTSPSWLCLGIRKADHQAGAGVQIDVEAAIYITMASCNEPRTRQRHGYFHSGYIKYSCTLSGCWECHLPLQGVKAAVNKSTPFVIAVAEDARQRATDIRDLVAVMRRSQMQRMLGHDITTSAESNVSDSHLPTQRRVLPRPFLRFLPRPSKISSQTYRYYPSSKRSSTNRSSSRLARRRLSITTLSSFVTTLARTALVIRG